MWTCLGTQPQNAVFREVVCGLRGLDAPAFLFGLTRLGTIVNARREERSWISGWESEGKEKPQRAGNAAFQPA